MPSPTHQHLFFAHTKRIAAYPRDHQPQKYRKMFKSSTVARRLASVQFSQLRQKSTISTVSVFGSGKNPA